jgi:ribosomal protein S18 acetylase RimI-like enzyme
MTPMESLRIRRLSRRDLEEVIRIDAIHTGAEQPEYWARLFREFLGRSPGHTRLGLAADVGGTLAAFLFAEVRAFEFGSEPCGWILEVGVDPAFARAGLGTALLDDAVRELRETGVAKIRTMVRRTNIPVLTFFRTNGFSGGPYVQLELLPGDDDV